MKLSRTVVYGAVISACVTAWGQMSPQQPPQLRTGVAASGQPAQNGPTKTAKKRVTTAKAAPTPTPAPIASPTPMQAMNPADMPPVPPQVIFKNGMLTVNAVNSTLTSLLTAIRNKTGIEFEGAELAGQDRVAISMGPATEGEVLASILSGSALDYVVMGRPDSPTIVQRVLLSKRTRPGATAVAGGQPAPAAGATESDEDTPDENAVEPEQPQDTAAQVPPPPGQQPTPAQQPDPNQAGSPKTPEQLLQQLKQLQQQQSGQIPDPNSAPRKQPPQM